MPAQDASSAAPGAAPAAAAAAAPAATGVTAAAAAPAASAAPPAAGDGGRGGTIRLVLDESMRLGAKIKSFQDRSKLPKGAAGIAGLGDAGSSDGSAQPLCILITQVTPGGSAEQFGLRLYDRLLLVDGTPVEAFQDYHEVLNLLRDKRPLSMTFACRGGPAAGLGGPFEALPAKSKVQRMLERFEKALLSKDIAEVRRVAFGGIPERLRPVFWRVLLGYLPPDMDQWDEVLRKKREMYEQYKAEFLGAGLTSADGSSRPSRLKGQGWWEADEAVARAKAGAKARAAASGTPAAAVVAGDAAAAPQARAAEEAATAENNAAEVGNHPLAQAPGDAAAEKQHRHDVELRETIWKDVQRTHPGFHFFADTRCEIMERILFIYAKLNPGIEYVQGMNEVVAPILFVFGSVTLDHDSNKQEAAQSRVLGPDQFALTDNYEADTFFCFCNLMGDIRDLYMEGMDADRSGIKGKGRELMHLLRDVDMPVYLHLVELQVDPQFFALRWLTTLLSRELMLPDTVRLWDSVFSCEDRFAFVLRACCAMIRLQRDDLLAADFSGCIQILQKYPPTELHLILAQADNLGQPLPGGNGPAAPARPPALNLAGLASATSDLLTKGTKFFSADSRSR